MKEIMIFSKWIAISLVSIVCGSALGGCSSGGTNPDCLEVTAGDVSDAIKVAGEFGAVPEITYQGDLAANSLQRTVGIVGDGEFPQTGQIVSAMVTLFNAETGTRLDAVQSDLEVNNPENANPIRAGVDCLAIGSRSVSVFPADDLMSRSTLAAVGLKPEDTLIQVVDIVSLNR